MKLPGRGEFRLYYMTAALTRQNLFPGCSALEEQYFSDL